MSIQLALAKSRRGSTINSIFKLGKASLFQTALLVVLSLFFIYSDTHEGMINRLRNRLTVLSYPVQWLVDAPIRLVTWVGHSLTLQTKLIEKNAQLRANELLLQSKLQRVLILQKENSQLKQLLQTRSQLTGRVQQARILAIELAPMLRQMVITGGTDKGFYVGQPVLDGYGVMGQVVAVGPLSSRVLLISDKRFSIPVQDYRNGFRAIANGASDGDRLFLANVMPNSDIKVGDVFVTSGYGLRFPIGYPVGVVTKVDETSQGRFMQVMIMPSAHLNQTQLVLLAWPKQAQLRQAVMQQLKQPIV